jgi:hypothetical protein
MTYHISQNLRLTCSFESQALARYTRREATCLSLTGQCWLILSFLPPSPMHAHTHTHPYKKAHTRVHTQTNILFLYYINWKTSWIFNLTKFLYSWTFEQQIKKLCSLATSNFQMCCQTFPAQRSKGGECCHGRPVFHMKVGIHGPRKTERPIRNSGLQIIGVFQDLFIADFLCHFNIYTSH